MSFKYSLKNLSKINIAISIGNLFKKAEILSEFFLKTLERNYSLKFTKFSICIYIYIHHTTGFYFLLISLNIKFLTEFEIFVYFFMFSN